MTRMEKWADKRAEIEKENKNYSITNFFDSMTILCEQRIIKKEGRYKH